MVAPESKSRFQDPSAVIVLKQWVEELPAKLAELNPTQRVILYDGKDIIAEISAIKGVQGLPDHFMVLPGKCTANVRAKGETTMVYEPSSDIFRIEPGGAGGHYIPGVIVKVADLYLKLPEFNKPETGAVSYSSLNTPTLPGIVTCYPEWACVYHGKKTTQLAAEQLFNGSVAILLGNGGRTNNQDVLGYSKKDGNIGSIFVLDGNLHRGDIAAQIIAERITDSLKAGKDGGAALESGSKYLGDYLQRNPARARGVMGTCALVFDIENAQCTTTHVGDCRGLILRRNENDEFTVLHKTSDHSISEELRKLNTPQSVIDAFRGKLSRGISLIPSSNSSDQHETSEKIPLRPGDVLVAMSDGLQILPEKELLEICTREESAEKIIAACTLAIEKHISESDKTADNYSLVVFSFNP